MILVGGIGAPELLFEEGYDDGSDVRFAVKIDGDVMESALKFRTCPVDI